MPRTVIEIADSAWFKSSYSGANETECVEAAFTTGHTAVRDSKRPHERRLQVRSETWTNFIGAVQNGQFS